MLSIQDSQITRRWQTTEDDCVPTLPFGGVSCAVEEISGLRKKLFVKSETKREVIQRILNNIIRSLKSELEGTLAAECVA